MIDTHAHLNCLPLLDRVDEIISQSKQAGLTGIIIASSDLASSKKAVELAEKYPGFLWASVGIHPQKTDIENKDSIQTQLTQLESLITTKPGNVIAVGECGLDFSAAPAGEKDRSQQEQEKLFLGQINLASKYDLPLLLHVRQASNEVLEFIRNFAKNNPQAIKNLRGVFHCYSGGKKRIKQILDLPDKWYFGIDGNVTYDQGLQKTVAQIPYDRLLLETDAPYLTPHPFRGKINNPAYLPLIAKKIAALWQISPKKVREQTLINTKKLFFP